jgi:hypothetical protein
MTLITSADKTVAVTVQTRAAASPQHAFKVNLPVDLSLVFRAGDHSLVSGRLHPTARGRLSAGRTSSNHVTVAISSSAEDSLRSGATICGPVLRLPLGRASRLNVYLGTSPHRDVAAVESGTTLKTFTRVQH